MKPVFSLDRLATTDLTHTIIGASNLTNSVLASDLCRQALREKRMEIQASPRSAEVKCSDVLHCHSGKVTGSPPPSSCSGWPLPSPSPGAAAGALPALKQQPRPGRPGPGSAPRTPHSARGPGRAGGEREKQSYRTDGAEPPRGRSNARPRARPGSAQPAPLR